MRISSVRWILDPKREGFELHLVLNHRDEAPWRSALRILSKLVFFLENLSTSLPMKQIGGDKGGPLLTLREISVAPLFSHVSGAVLTLCFLGNTFCQWGKSVTSSKEGKLQGVNLFHHFSRENFEGLEQTRGYLSRNMRVTYLDITEMSPKV